MTETQLAEIKHDLSNLKQISVVNNFDMNVNCKRGGSANVDSFCFDSGPMGLPNIEERLTTAAQVYRDIESADCESDDERAPSLSHMQDLTKTPERATVPTTNISEGVPSLSHQRDLMASEQVTLPVASTDPVREATNVRMNESKA